MTKFSARSVEIYDLPLPDACTLLHPESVMLRYFKSHTIDFGALCYLRRRTEGRRKHGKGRDVDLSSFSPERTSQVRALIEFVSEAVGNGRQRRISLDTSHRYLLKFMDWCDANGHCDVLEEEKFARSAFRGYVDYLRRLVSQNQLNNNTAARYHNICRDTLEAFLNIESLDRGINMIARSAIFETPTPVPSEDAQGKVIAWCHSLFYGISELLVEQKSYPFAMAAPEYMRWPGDRLWAFPCQQWCRPPGSLHERHKGPIDHAAYDYDAGHVFTFEELKAQYGHQCTRKQMLRLRAEALRVIAAANRDLRSRSRVDRGILAVKVFMLMFVASTGMNPSQAVSLPCSPELDAALDNPRTERQGFRTIKYRANNRVVWFEIGVQFMPHFRRFLQLRRYLLAGIECPHLFFGYKRTDLYAPVPWTADIFVNTFDILHRFDPTLPKVMPTEWRAAKQDHVIRHNDPHTAARTMQHSVTTALRKYSNGSETAHQMEMGSFLAHVEKVVLACGQKVEHGETRSIGICSAPSHPVPISGQVPVQPDCKGPEGCLFCDQYRVHADETDTRKLLSCRHCIRKTSHLASSQEQFGRVFGVVLGRIGFILGEIGRRDGPLVERIEHEVDVDGELDPYWAIKLETLMELDLV